MLDRDIFTWMLRDAGFDTVDVQLNVENLEFKRAIRKFEADADRADIAVVYYAGHGLEIAGTNYLIPVDARLASDRDADDEAISLERLVSSADGAKRLRLIIVDACRDNPFVTTMRRERKTASRGVAGGLGWVEPTSTDVVELKEVHPQSGYEKIYPQGGEVILDGGTRLGIECTAQAAVNVSAEMVFEE